MRATVKQTLLGAFCQQADRARPFFAVIIDEFSDTVVFFIQVGMGLVPSSPEFSPHKRQPMIYLISRGRNGWVLGIGGGFTGITRHTSLLVCLWESTGTRRATLLHWYVGLLVRDLQHEHVRFLMQQHFCRVSVSRAILLSAVRRVSDK